MTPHTHCAPEKVYYTLTASMITQCMHVRETRRLRTPMRINVYASRERMHASKNMCDSDETYVSKCESMCVCVKTTNSLIQHASLFVHVYACVC